MGLNVVMMATGPFALPGFRAMVESPHTISALITQPDRVNPRGKPHPHPVKEFAQSHDIPVLQPESVNTPEAVRQLQSLRPDVVLVAAYGQILKAEVIDVPRLGMYNLHGSLLPRHRGAAPVQYAIWKGDEKTGVTIFRIEPKLDAGPMIVKKETAIEPRETTGQLHDRLAELGAAAMLETVDLLEQGTAQPLPQNEEEVTLAPKIQKSQGEIDWSKTNREIDCHIRAMHPWPKPFTFLQSTEDDPIRFVIHDIETTNETPFAAPGSLKLEGDRLHVATGDGVLEITKLQPDGKKAMATADFLRGFSWPENSRFVCE